MDPVSILSVRDVTIERGGLPIVRGASLEVEAGAVTVLLGVNGAGKTTLLEGISGVVALASGEVRLGGHRVDRWRAWRRARLGLAHVEQGRTVFGDLTTEDNLRVASAGASVERSFELFPELLPRRDTPAGLLSGGEQQMLVLARALVRDPKVLLLDELSLGLAPMVLERLMAAVKTLAGTGMAILLVDQFAPLALAVGRRVYVLRGGEIVFGGDCADLAGDEDRLHALYFGASSGDAGATPERSAAR